MINIKAKVAMGRIINNNKTEDVDRTFKDLCCDIYQGEYVLVLGGDVVLKPQYADGNSQDYVKSEFRKANGGQEMNKWTLSNFLKTEWEYDLDEISGDLVALLSTRCFRVVLTTTFDGYVEAVMRHVYGKELRVRNVYDKADTGAFFPSGEFAVVPPTLYYVFGKADSRFDYVFSENDAIKVIATRWLGENRPTDLIKYMSGKKVLAIGCKFDDWYFRVFWYCLRQNFENLAGDVAISLQEESESDRKLAGYLERINVGNKGESKRFVHELSSLLNDPVANVYDKFYNSLRAGGVFISYASEDFPIVCQIYGVLVKAGVPVWFDNAELRGGDQYDKRIGNAIGQCKVFMPILSKQVKGDLTQGRWRYYKNVEWEAIRDNKQSRVVPVTLQGFDIKTDRELLPETFRDKSVVSWSQEGERGVLSAL